MKSAPHKKMSDSKFSMNSALKLHQKLFLKLKQNKKKVPSSIEKLLTPFVSDRLHQDEPAERISQQSFMSENSSMSKSDHDSASDRDSSEIREKKERQKKKAQQIATDYLKNE